MKKIILFLLFLLIKQFIAFSQNYVLYGVTTYGGNPPAGVLYCYNPFTGKYQLLHNFNFSGDAGEPMGGTLVQDTVTHYIYGMTYGGGSYLNGAIFRYDPVRHIDTVIYSMDIPTGILPYGSISFASNGLLYGMTSKGGGNRAGTFFSFNPTTFSYNLIFSFDTVNGDGETYCQPYQAKDSMIYCMTNLGGNKNLGLLFRYNPKNNQDTVLMRFDSINNGGRPANGVIQATNGLLYGFSYIWGKYGYGVMFSYNPITKKDSVLINFDGINEAYPEGNLLQANNGLLYAIIPDNIGSAGILIYNPLNGWDTLVPLMHNESFSLNFNNNLIQDPDNGLLYGTTTGGGDSNDNGTLFSFNPVTLKDSLLLSFGNSIGTNPVGRLLLSKSFPLTANQSTINPDVVNIYPNPFNSNITLEFINNEHHFIEIYDMLGRKWSALELTGKITTIKTACYSPGMYFIKTFNNQYQYITTLKVLKE